MEAQNWLTWIKSRTKCGRKNHTKNTFSISVKTRGAHGQNTRTSIRLVAERSNKNVLHSFVARTTGTILYLLLVDAASCCAVWMNFRRERRHRKRYLLLSFVLVLAHLHCDYGAKSTAYVFAYPTYGWVVGSRLVRGFWCGGRKERKQTHRGIALRCVAGFFVFCFVNATRGMNIMAAFVHTFFPIHILECYNWKISSTKLMYGQNDFLRVDPAGTGSDYAESPVQVIRFSLTYFGEIFLRSLVGTVCAGDDCIVRARYWRDAPLECGGCWYIFFIKPCTRGR